MSYIGKKPTSSFASATSQTFTGNNSTTAFTLNRRVSAPEDLEVFVSNIQQQPTTSYTIGSTGLALNFDSAPPSGEFYVVYRNEAGTSAIDVGAARTANANTFSAAQTFSGGISGTTGTFSGDITANGNIAGDNSTNITGIAGVTATSLTGTLQTAAQTNITSVGTLTSATISGDLTVDTTSLKVNSTNNNVGIGVSNAESAVKLEVNAGSDGAVGISCRSDGGNGNNRRFNLIPYASGGTYGGGLRVQSRNSSNVFETALEIDNSKILSHYAQSQWLVNGASTALYFKDASNSNYGVCGFEPATYNGGTNRWYTQNSTNFAIAYGGVNGFFMKYDTRQIVLSNNGQSSPGSTVHQLTLGYNLGGNKGGLYMPTYSYYNDVNFKIVNNDTHNGRQSDDILFHRNGSRHGGIRIIGASGVSYQSISDYREKTDEKPIEDAIGTIKKLKPYNFMWKKSGKRQDGFFAHEVDEILDYAVSGEKDATKTYEGVVLNKEGNMIASEIKKEEFDKRLDDGDDEEASPIGETTYPEGSTWKETYEDIEPQQMDPAKLVPILTAALQEAIKRIEVLESK